MTEISIGRTNTEMTRNGLKDQGIAHGQTALSTPVFDKKLTVNIELLGEVKIPTYEIIQSARLLCGGLLACRSIGTRKYELTMSNDKGKQRLLEGFKIGNTTVVASELCNDEMVVSFLNLPAYITDAEILEKLHGWGVKATSAIRRRMWPGTRIADGTLPYSTRFSTALGAEYFRVIHDKQIKVCRMCIQPGHILRDCPEFSCHKCGVQGHFARECSMEVNKCKICHNKLDKCICNNSEDSNVLYSEFESEMEEGSSESENHEQGEVQAQGKESVEKAADSAALERSSTYIGASLDSVGASLLVSRPVVKDGGEGLLRRPEPPPEPAEGSTQEPKHTEVLETAHTQPPLLEKTRNSIPSFEIPSAPDTDEDMDIAALIPAHKRLNIKQGKNKLKKLKEKLK